MASKTANKTPKCFFDNGNHDATIRLSYQFKNAQRKNHYTVCDQHREQFSNENLVAERRIG